jgi:ABC-2 type transport system permease protein
MLAIYKKELKVYFTSILGYVLMGVYLLIAAMFFTGYFLGIQNTSDFSGFFTDMNTVFLFIIPIMTFRILVEDKKLGTYELLLTSPVTAWEIILGKFLATFTFVWIGTSILLVFPLVLTFFTTIDWGEVLSGYLGILFTLSFFIAAGVFASSLTNNYVVAGLIAFVLFLVFYIIAYFGNAPDNLFSRILKELSYSIHYNQFAQGVITLKDILYFLIGTFLWLFLAKSVVESKTWK